MRFSRSMSTALAAAFWLAACGSDDPDLDLSPDADTGAAQACDPVDQGGCDDGEKCGNRIESEDPLETVDECLPEGDVGVGEACDLVGEPEAGEGYDDCEAGLTCSLGECRAICEFEDGAACGGDERCVPVGSFFGDEIGFCADACDPVEQDCAFEHAGEDDGDEDEDFSGACYLHPEHGDGTCLNVADGAEDRGQGDACIVGDAGEIFINGCSGGHGCAYPSGQVMACGAYCEPTADFDGAPCAESGGPGADGYECRYLGPWYEFLFQVRFPGIEEDAGVCIPTDLEGLDPCSEDPDGPGCQPELEGAGAPRGAESSLAPGVPLQSPATAPPAW